MMWALKWKIGEILCGGWGWRVCGVTLLGAGAPAAWACPIGEKCGES